MSARPSPLTGNLIAGLTPKIGVSDGCDGPVDCVQLFGSHLADRALAGLNRVMEQGVEPLARMIWAPSPSPGKGKGQEDGSPQKQDRSPLREPPITADPLVLRGDPESLNDQQVDQNGIDQQDEINSLRSKPLPPDLPPPELLEEAVDSSVEAIPDNEPSSSDQDNDEIKDELIGAPPPPELPPLPPLDPLPLRALPTIERGLDEASGNNEG